MRVGITYNIRPKAEGLRLKKDKETGNPSALSPQPYRLISLRNGMMMIP